jgi:hypothetical protein
LGSADGLFGLAESSPGGLTGASTGGPMMALVLLGVLPASLMLPGLRRMRVFLAAFLCSQFAFLGILERPG